MPYNEGEPRGGGRWRLLNPLAIRFSQPRIAPHFRDGHILHETVAEVYEAQLQSAADAAASAEGSSHADAASGTPPYDVVLMPPFPGIRVISWLPKIRRPDGEAERDAYGDQILGKRAWFALDNRRLHTLQCAAAKRWPRRCCVAVRCIEEVPGTTIRELRKFRTTTEGRSIEVGVRVGETQAWSWHKAAPPGARVDDVVEPEGLFAEDLHCAVRWAPHAVAAGSKDEVEAEEPAEAPAAAAPPAVAPAQTVATSNGSNGRVGSAGYAGGYGSLSAGYPGGGGGGGYARRSWLAACPDMGWQYVDPSGKIQGPFGLEKMRLWNQHGFFYADLPMRCDPADSFVKLSELFPGGSEPFKGPVLRQS